jgi:hypothetical protein
LLFLVCIVLLPAPHFIFHFIFFNFDSIHWHRHDKIMMHRRFVPSKTFAARAFDDFLTINICASSTSTKGGWNRSSSQCSITVKIQIYSPISDGILPVNAAL